MIQLIKRLLKLDVTPVKGEVVYGKLKDSDKACYIPFSKNSGDSPVIATEQFATPKTGFDLSAPLILNKTTGDNKLQLSMSTQGYNNKIASMDLKAGSQYLLIGGREYNVGSYRGIGFGYVAYTNQIAPVFVGMQETDETNNTIGDLVFATRPTTDISAPTVRLTIDSKGQIRSAVDYSPSNDADLTTKFYVDNAVSTATGTPLIQGSYIIQTPINMSPSTSQEFIIPSSHVKVDDFVLVSFTENLDYFKFVLQGFVAKDGEITLRVNCTGAQEGFLFPAGVINYKVVKYT